ncbi:hypothetical protein DB346_09410 [Verrucomicrobia bacterium LW23]|nr:hypothetical protein DB346_09410 [Verrucomicrobia bacterium LW23]
MKMCLESNLSQSALATGGGGAVGKEPDSDGALNYWYRRCYRRFLVDMHIPDWDEKFLSRLDAGDFVDTLVKGRSSSVMVYCNSHAGPALYPSKVGPVHKSLGHRDFVAEVLQRARGRGLSVVAYYSVIYNNAAFLEHPDWRIVPFVGEEAYEGNRYGTCCPNSPYRHFAIAQTEELCARYDFDGIFFDMLFWPFACYCPHCKSRFLKEEGKELPVIVNWNDPTWMAFQRARERWMKELAGLLTEVVRRVRPSMTATHQLSPVLHGWRMAMPYDLTDVCDYASGDFYGPPAHQSFVCKIFEALSVRKPFEFMTSRCIHLWDHVTMKTASKMEMQAFLAPAHAAGFMFIDAIDPVGTLNPRVYERIGRIFPRLEPYEKFLGGDLAADVAIYVSGESRFSFRANGTHIRDWTVRADNMATQSGMPHLEAAIGAGRSLQAAHIPYAVVTKRNLESLKKYRVVILPNVLVTSDEEVEAFRSYVAAGGTLYASGYSSLVAEDGRLRDDFGLADVFGVSANKMMEHSLAYISPESSPEAAAFAAMCAPQEHLIHRNGWMEIENRTATVLSSITRPWCPENEGSALRHSFASIHSSPPGLTSQGPAVTLHRYEAGKACYSAGAMEHEDQEVNRRVFAQLIRHLHGGTIPVEATTHASVELTVFDKPAVHRMNISLVSLNQDQEPLPCKGTVLVRPGGKVIPTALRRLPGGEAYPFRAIPGGIAFDFEGLEIFAMWEVDYTNA